MKYTLAITIDRPLEEVIRLFDDPANWRDWREGFVSAEAMDGIPGEAGSVTRLVSRIGGRDTVMTESVESKNLPAEMTCIYEVPGRWLGAWNRVVNRFRAIDLDHSEWQFESEFRCRGLLRLVSLLMPGMFRNASLQEMNRFKAFVEADRSVAA